MVDRLWCGAVPFDWNRTSFLTFFSLSVNWSEQRICSHSSTPMQQHPHLQIIVMRCITFCPQKRRSSKQTTFYWSNETRRDTPTRTERVFWTLVASCWCSSSLPFIVPFLEMWLRDQTSIRQFDRDCHGQTLNWTDRECRDGLCVGIGIRSVECPAMRS